MIVEDDQKIAAVVARNLEAAGMRCHIVHDGESAVRAYWENLELVTAWEIVKGPRVRRTFRINDDGRLEVVMRFVAGRSPEPVEFALVYDNADE